MIFNILIVIIFILNVQNGFKEGLVKAILKFIARIIEVLISFWYAKDLSQLIFSQTDLAHNYLGCNGISFFIIFLTTVIGFKIIIRFVDNVTRLPLLHQVNSLGGAILSFVVTYLLMFLILSILITIPNDYLVNQYHDSVIAEFIVNKTPMISHEVLQKLLR
jgi:uncharacterized membrane protein required for colicin V production